MSQVHTPRRRWRYALGAVLALGVTAGLWLRTERAESWVCAQLEQRLPQWLDAQVQIGRCTLEPFSGSVAVGDVVVSTPGSAAPFLSAHKAAVSLGGLLWGAVSISDVELVRPRVEVTLPAPTPAAEATECPLKLLSRVRVGRLKVTDGSLVLHSAGARTLRLDGLMLDASLGKRELTLALDGRGGAWVDAERTIRLGKLAVEGSVDLSAGQLDVQKAEVNLEGLRATAWGTVESLCDAAPALDLTTQVYVPLAALHRVGVSLPTPSGQLLARAKIEGSVRAPSIQAEVQGAQVQIGPFSPGEFFAKGFWKGNLVVVEELRSSAGEGELRVSGTVSLEPGNPVEVKVETRQASFAEVLARAGVPGSWVEFPASVKGTVKGHLLPSPQLSGDIEFHTGAFSLAARAYDASPQAGPDILAFSESAGTFRLGVTKEAVTFDRVAVRAGPQGATRVEGAVKLLAAAPGGIDLDVTATSVHLSDFGSIATLPWAGDGQAHVTVKGPFTAIRIDGHTTLRDFKLAGYSLGVVQGPLHYQGDTLSFSSLAAQKGQTQYFGDVELRFAEAGLYTRASIQLPDGRVEDVVDILADLSPSMQNLQDGVLTGRVSALAVVDSPAKELTGVIAAQVRQVSYLDRRLGEAGLLAHFEQGEALALEPAVFIGPLGRLSVEGRWRFSGPLDYHLEMQEGSLQELAVPGSADQASLGGEFSARAQVSGTTDLMVVDGSIDAPEVSWKTRALGPMHLEAKAVGRALQAKGSLFSGLDGDIAVSMRDDWPFRASLNVDAPEVSAFLPEAATSLAIRLRGEMGARGALKAWRNMLARATFEEVSVARGDISARNTEPVRLAWNAGAIDIGALELQGPTTSLSAVGTWGPQTANLKTQGSIDLRLLSSLTRWVERTQGRLEFAATVTGPVTSPSLAGSATLSDARFVITGQELAVRALSGQAHFSESRMLIQDLQGFLNEGKVRLQGDLVLSQLAVKKLELQADLEEVPVQVQPEVPATLTGSLLLASRDGTQFQLSGGLDVEKLIYRRMIAEWLAKARETPVPSDERPREWLRFDVDLRTGEQVRLENEIRGRVSGRLQVTGTNVKPTLSGLLELEDGAQAAFRGNTYNVQRGLLQFSGLWPTFELAAQSQIREYLVSVKAFGRLNDPQIAYSSEPGLPEADVLSLVTLGVTSRDQLTRETGVGLAAGALFSASGLDVQVQRFLSQNVGLRDQQVKLTTSFNETTGSAEPAVSWESTVMSDKLKLGVTQPVTGRGTKAQVEYRINQRVSARAQWDNLNQNTSVGNPGVELRFRFEWE